MNNQVSDIGTGESIYFIFNVLNVIYRFTTGPPPTTLYVGNRRTICHILKNPRPKCCLRWGEVCIFLFAGKNCYDALVKKYHLLV
jgi:hypothetical protein